MIEESAWMGWGYYLLGAAGLMLVWWKITRLVPWPFVQHQLLLMMLVLLVYPFDVGEGFPDLAPATLMLLMETVFEGGEAFNRVGPALIAVVLGATILLGLFEWGLFYWRRQQRKAQLEQQGLTAARDELLAQTQPSKAD